MHCVDFVTDRVALPDLGCDTYKCEQGGLYPGGLNQPPDSYLQEGLSAAAEIQPLDAYGNPSPTGKIALLAVGMSNTTLEFTAFKPLAESDPDKNPSVVLINGAQGGQASAAIEAPSANYWTVVSAELAANGVTSEQVQVVWLKQVLLNGRLEFPDYAEESRASFQRIVDTMTGLYPNLKIVYLSNRTYGGWFPAPNPEPRAYESGFGVKWLIEDRISSGAGPWLAWGPYLWANGLDARGDGLVWAKEDFAVENNHVSSAGQRKVADLLLNFLKSYPTAAPWFLR